MAIVFPERPVSCCNNDSAYFQDALRKTNKNIKGKITAFLKISK
jgi:hypothetical protein